METAARSYLEFLGVANKNSLIDEGVYCRPFTVASGCGLLTESLIIILPSGIFELLGSFTSYLCIPFYGLLSCQNYDGNINPKGCITQIGIIVTLQELQFLG